MLPVQIAVVDLAAIQSVLESDLLVAVVDLVVEQGVLQVVEVDLAVR